MNWCGQSWAKGLFISTFMPINCKKPNGKSYLGHRNSKQVGVWPLPRSGGHVCVFCALLKCIWSESQNKHGQGAIVFASAGTRASVVTYESESRHQPGWARMERGSHKTLPVPRLLPPLPTPRSEPWGLKDEVMWLIPLYLLSRGSEQPLFGCLFFFFFQNSPSGTHIRSVWQSVTPCLFLNHILFSTVANIQPQGRYKLPGHTTTLKPLIKMFYPISRFALDISPTVIRCRKF